MKSEGSNSAVLLFITTLVSYVLVIWLLAVGQLLLALLVVLVNILRPRSLPHVFAVVLYWPHLLRTSDTLEVGVKGIEVHPVCLARHYLDKLRHGDEVDEDDVTDLRQELREAVERAVRELEVEARRNQAEGHDDGRF